MKKDFSVAIVGYGVVGKAMRLLFPKAVVYNGEKHPGPQKGVTYADINKTDVVFVCVPTPMKSSGHCDTSIVEEVISKLETPLVIIRSTIEPGTTDRLKKKYKKRIVFCPEYLGETVAHPFVNERSRPFLILGGAKDDTNLAIEIFQTVYNASLKIRQMSAIEAEITKYLENRHIAFTVAECNEAYDLCKKLGIDYSVVREAVFQDDPRMSPYWTFVYPNNRGFETKCIPKDVYAITSFARDMGSPMKITESILEQNKKWRNKK